MPAEPTKSSKDQPTPPPWFQFGEKTTPCVRQVAEDNFRVTANDQTASIAFDNLLADLQGGDAPLSAVVGVAFELPVEALSKDPFLGYVADLRGFCSKSLGARAVFILQLGGTTYTHNFPYDEEHNDSWFAQVFSFERRPNKDSGLPIIPLPPLTINVMISVQRRTPDDFVQLTLDSIDLSADRI